MFQSNQIPTPPAPGNPDEAMRWEHTSHRLALMEGRWARLLEDRMEAQLGSTRRMAMGLPDMSTNSAKVIWTELATLYDAEPDPKHHTAGDVPVLLGPDGLVARSGLWAQMGRFQALTIGLREMWMRIDVEDGRITYRPVPPNRTIAESDPSRPTYPKAYAEVRLRHLRGEYIWCWDVFDIRDPENPRCEVRISGDGGKFGEDVTLEVLGGNFSGAAYPYRRKDGTPILPVVLYHASLYGDRLFDPYFGIETYEGSLNLALYYTYLAHCLRDASYPQRWAIGVRVAGADVTDATNRASRVEVVTDPTTILMLDAAMEQQPQVGQFNAGADVRTLEATIAAIAHRLATDAGLSPTELQRTSGSAQSGYAISLNNEGKRVAQRKYIQQFRRGDEELLAKSAILYNRAVGTDFPEGGYSIIYREIPLSPEELQARRTHALEMMQAGLMDRVEALRLFGFISEADAVAKLQAIDAGKAPTPSEQEGGMEASAPAPAADVSTSGGIDDVNEEIDAATRLLEGIASTAGADTADVIAAVLDSLREVKSYVAGSPVTASEDATDGESCPIETQDIAANLKNRQRALDVANYGPPNPDAPGDYWQGKATRMRATVDEVIGMTCGNCAFFNVTTKMQACIEQGIGAEGDVIKQVGQLGFCEAFDFKCAARRTCDAWVVGGPLTDAGLAGGATVKTETTTTPTQGADPEESVAAAATSAGVPASAVAMNGAQVQAAQGIVTSVAKGELPRATGVAMLVQFFNMPEDAAEKMMGEVGRSFTMPTTVA
jgi:hypothetical protein